MPDKVHLMKIDQVPHSSVVGGSLNVVDPKLGVVAILAIMVPQPNLDYRTVADAVAAAILNGRASHRGITLVLPENFGQTNSR